MKVNTQLVEVKGENQTDLDKMSKQVEQLKPANQLLIETRYVCRICYVEGVLVIIFVPPASYLIPC